MATYRRAPSHMTPSLSWLDGLRRQESDELKALARTHHPRASAKLRALREARQIALDATRAAIVEARAAVAAELAEAARAAIVAAVLADAARREDADLDAAAARASTGKPLPPPPAPAPAHKADGQGDA